jgi:predicted dehydrogenase
VNVTRLGIVGTGFISIAHARMLKRATTPFMKAKAFDIDPRRSAEFSKRGGWTPASSLDEVLDSCDALLVTTWTSEHRSIVEAAAVRGIHVFCEKPLATNVADARAMVHAVQSAGVIHQCGLVLRWSPAFVVARALALEAAAGDVMAVVLRDDQYLPIQGRYASQWRGEISKSGGGVLIEHSVHDMDLLESIIGPVANVRAHISYRDGLMGIDDVAAATLVGVNGGVATLTTVWHDNTARESNRHLEIICQRRIITVSGDDWFGPVSWQDPDAKVHVLGPDELVLRATALLGAPPNPDDGFLRAISLDEPATPDLTLALRAQRLVEAGYLSHNRGGVVVDV